MSIQNPIRKTALSELSFCSCGYFAKEIFKIMLIHASMIRKFMKIALALNSYKQMQEENTHDKKKENEQRNCKNTFRFTGIRNGSRCCSGSTARYIAGAGGK